jgi:hypothetical protein
MAAVFPFLPEPESQRRELAIESLVLNGQTLDAHASAAIKDIPYERSIEGASTVQLVLVDPDGDLLDSGLFSAAVDIELPSPSAIVPAGGGLPIGSDDPLGFRLVRIRTSGATLTLEFEDREVALLRAHKSLRHASRADVTRAEFIRSMVREVKVKTIRFWSPELHQSQPISSVRDIVTKKTKQDRRAPGFGSATVKVKGHTADRAQIRLLEQGLETAVSLHGSEDVMIGLVEAMTQESVVQNDPGNVAGITGGHKENVGVLHQDERYWPATRNVPRDATPFIRRLITVRKAHRGKSIGWCVDQVQRSYSVGTPGQGQDYDQWEAEARETVSAYTGNADLTQGTVAQSTYRQRFLFRRGEPGGEREDTWTASGRLASEVNFRRFIDYGVFHYVSDDYLRKAAPRLIIDRRHMPDGIARVNIGDFDTGKPRRNQQGKNVGGAEVRVDVFVDVLEPPLGGVWILKGYGPCDGRYLITNVRGSYLTPLATVTLSLPVPKLSEPAPTVGTRATTEAPDVKRSFNGGNLSDAYDEAWRIHKKRYPYVWGGGHAHAGTPDTGLPGTAHDELTDREHIGFDCSGAVAAVLKAAGYLPDRYWGGGAPVSGGFARWGEAGEGRNLTVWYNDVHVFIEFRHMTDANKTEHWGTGRWGKDWGGPGFNPSLHPHAGFSPRHWGGRQSPTTTVQGHPVQEP